MGGLEIENLKVSESTLQTLEEIREEIRQDVQTQSQALSKINELIKLLEGENEISFHPDLPSPKDIPGAPPYKPAKPEPSENVTQEMESPPSKFDKTQPYKMVTTRSAILNLLGKWRGTPLPATKVAARLQDGGWGKDIKDPIASTRAALSGMRLELDVRKIDNVLHYSLFPVEET